jgi:hypothetical protein
MKIIELASKNAILDSDYLVIDDNNITYKITAQQLYQYIKEGILREDAILKRPSGTGAYLFDSSGNAIAGQRTSEKNQANGYPGLNANIRIDASQMADAHRRYTSDLAFSGVDGGGFCYLAVGGQSQGVKLTIILQSGSDHGIIVEGFNKQGNFRVSAISTFGNARAHYAVDNAHLGGSTIFRFYMNGTVPDRTRMIVIEGNHLNPTTNVVTYASAPVVGGTYYDLPDTYNLEKYIQFSTPGIIASNTSILGTTEVTYTLTQLPTISSGFCYECYFAANTVTTAGNQGMYVNSDIMDAYTQSTGLVGVTWAGGRDGESFSRGHARFTLMVAPNKTIRYKAIDSSKSLSFATGGFLILGYKIIRN